MTDRLMKARNWLARAEAEMAEFQRRIAAGRGRRGMYEDLSVGRSLYAAQQEVLNAEAEANEQHRREAARERKTA